MINNAFEIINKYINARGKKNIICNQYLFQDDLKVISYRSILKELEVIRKKLNLKRFSFGAKNKYTIHFSRDWEWPWAIVYSQVKKGEKVLDVGSGCTPFLPYLAQYGCKCYAVDPDPHYDLKVHRLEKVTSDYFAYVKKRINVNIFFKKESMHKLSFNSNFFDKVYCISVIEHITNDNIISTGISEMARVLKPKGILVITIDNDGHHTFQKDLYKYIIKLCQHSKLYSYGESNLIEPSGRDMAGKYNVIGLMFQK
jgi:ubiquinone/menaquinone biosynthesis C-methylase UbiE